MDQISRIGLDTSKHIFQLHGVNGEEKVVLRRKLLEFFAKLEPTVVGLEACGGSQHWAWELERLGRRVRLLAPQLVKPYVKRGKNDAADAFAGTTSWRQCAGLRGDAGAVSRRSCRA